MKKYLLTLSMIVLFVVYLAYQRSVALPPAATVTTTTTPNDVTVTPSIPDLTANPQVITPPPATPPVIIPKKPPVALGKYKDGTYTGNAADAYYGYIQVQAIVQNGKLTDVQFLQYPSDRRQSIEINSMAMPALRSEAITAQSANVAIVSRATDSSEAFRESLAGALARAKS